MTANAISSATSTAQQALQPRPLQQADAAKPAAETAKPGQTQEQQTQRTQQSGPVMNMQGQAIGTVISTTA
jgi:hypothetical protein